MFPRDMVCFRNISVDTLHKGDTEDNNNNNNDNNNTININGYWIFVLHIFDRLNDREKDRET